VKGGGGGGGGKGVTLPAGERVPPIGHPREASTKYDVGGFLVMKKGIHRHHEGGK